MSLMRIYLVLLSVFMSYFSIQSAPVSAGAGLSEVSTRGLAHERLCGEMPGHVKSGSNYANNNLSSRFVSVSVSKDGIRDALYPVMHDWEQYQLQRKRYQRWLPVLACLMRDFGISDDELIVRDLGEDDEDRAICQYFAQQPVAEEDVVDHVPSAWSRQHCDGSLHQSVLGIVARHKFDDLVEVGVAIDELHDVVAGMCSVVTVPEYHALLAQLKELKGSPLSANRACMSKVSAALALLPHESASAIRAQFPFYLRPLL